VDAELADFKIEHDGLRASVVVNGADVTKNVYRAVWDAEGNNPPRLILELSHTGGTIEGKGVVVVTPAESGAEAMSAWLGGIDVEALTREVLDRPDTLDGMNPVEATIAVLKEYLSGG
jgi:hypothetical protein